MNREATKRQLVQAVREIIKEKGFKGLTISKVARKANVDRKMICRYSGSLNYLVEAYVLKNDIGWRFLIL
jgi:AcrR family transcriptional regulator